MHRKLVQGRSCVSDLHRDSAEGGTGLLGAVTAPSTPAQGWTAAPVRHDRTRSSSRSPTHVQEDLIVHIGVPGALVLHAGVLDTHCGQLLWHKQHLSAHPRLPHGPCPAPSTPTLDTALRDPHPSQDRTNGQTPIRKVLTSSWFSNILEPEPSGKHLYREKRI